MTDDDRTSRELLLQLNKKLTDFIEASTADRASLNTKIESIESSVKVMNHNSTEMATRLTSLETSRTTEKATINTLKRLGYVGFAVVGSIGGLDLLLHILHVFGF